MTEEVTVTLKMTDLAAMLRIALAYGSREARIRALLHAAPPSVRFTVSQMKYAGLITIASVPEEGKLPQ